MTNEKAPERIYMHPTSAEANVNPSPLEPGEYVEYVRADLLATVRADAREAAFKEAMEIAKEVQQRCAASAISQQAFGAAKVVSALETTMGREVKTGNDN